MGWAYGTYRGRKRYAQNVDGEPEGKRPMMRPRPIWEDNSKMNLQEMGRGFGNWMELAQDRER
jgi:hypothetical protein